MPQDAYNDISMLLDKIADQLDNIPYSALQEKDAEALKAARDHARKAEAALAPLVNRYADWSPE